MNAGGVICIVLGIETILALTEGQWWKAAALATIAVVAGVYWPAEV